MPYAHEQVERAQAPVARVARVEARTDPVREQVRRTAGYDRQAQLLKPKASPIVYVGMNPGAAAEARTLGRANADQGGVTAITNGKEAGKVRDARGVHDLTTPAGIAAWAATLGVGPDKARRIAELVGREGADARDELAQVARVYAEAQAGARRMERVVLSGHSVGGVIWGDGNGMIAFRTFEGLAAVFPGAAGQVRDLMVAACYTGGEAKLDQYFRMFPGLQTIWAYSGSSPGANSGAQAHMKLWEKASEGTDPAKVDRDVARGTRKAESVATWNATAGYKGDKPVALSVARAAVAGGETVFQDHLAGRAEVADPQAGPLRTYYNAVQRLLSHPQADAGTRAAMEARRDVTIRLLFFASVRQRFASAYGPLLEAGYTEAGMAMPDFAGLPRGAALERITSFAASAGGGQKAAHCLDLLQRGLRDLDPAIVPASWV